MFVVDIDFTHFYRIFGAVPTVWYFSFLIIIIQTYKYKLIVIAKRYNISCKQKFYSQIFPLYLCQIVSINIREYRRGNQKRTIQRNWKHGVHKKKKNNTKTPLCANKL